LRLRVFAVKKMKLREQILKEHSKRNCTKIVNWVGDDKNNFAELMNLMLHDEYRVAQRAAYAVSYAVQAHPHLIKPWFGKMIKKMGDKTAHDAIRRNALRILEDVDIPEKHCGILFEMSNNYLHDLKEPIAVRAFSISVMCNIATKFSDLKSEVKINAEGLLQCGIPALEARGRNTLKQLSK
jgi:hypothetical protein